MYITYVYVCGEFKEGSREFSFLGELIEDLFRTQSSEFIVVSCYFWIPPYKVNKRFMGKLPMLL